MLQLNNRRCYWSIWNFSPGLIYPSTKMDFHSVGRPMLTCKSSGLRKSRLTRFYVELALSELGHFMLNIGEISRKFVHVLPTMPLYVESGSNCTRLGSIAPPKARFPATGRGAPWIRVPEKKTLPTQHWTANPTSQNGGKKLSKPNPPATFSPNFS